MEKFPEGAVSCHAGPKSHQQPASGLQASRGHPNPGNDVQPARPGQHLSWATQVTTLEPQQPPQPSVDSAVVTPETSHLPRETKRKRLLQSVTEEPWGQFFQQA